MEQQDLFEQTFNEKGTLITHNNNQYQVIGQGYGIRNTKNKLPLNKIDEEIIEAIKKGLFNNELTNQHLNNHEIIDDKLHNCNDECQILENDIIAYIDEAINKIEEDSIKYNSKWERDYNVAFYKPFHFYKDWGIYLKATGIARSTAFIKNIIDQSNGIKYGRPDIESIYLINKTFVFYHEFYHHKIESLAVKFEITTRQPFYTKGFHCLYCNTFNTDRCLEEAFANTYAYFETNNFLGEYLNLLNISRKQLRFIIKNIIIRNSPPGYRLAEKIVAANNREIAGNFENYFFETLIRYSYKLLDIDTTPINDPLFWRLFKHATHPIINTENDVNYVIDLDDTTKIALRNIL